MSKKRDQQDVVDKLGGRFQLAAILEKRYKELLFGDRPLVTIDSDDPMDIMFEEVMQEKIELIPEAEAIAAATAALMADAEKSQDTADARRILGLDDEDEEEEDAAVEKDVLKAGKEETSKDDAVKAGKKKTAVKADKKKITVKVGKEKTSEDDAVKAGKKKATVKPDKKKTAVKTGKEKTSEDDVVKAGKKKTAVKADKKKTAVKTGKKKAAKKKTKPKEDKD